LPAVGKESGVVIVVIHTLDPRKITLDPRKIGGTLVLAALKRAVLRFIERCGYTVRHNRDYQRMGVLYLDAVAARAAEPRERCRYPTHAGCGDSARCPSPEDRSSRNIRSQPGHGTSFTRSRNRTTRRCSTAPATTATTGTAAEAERPFHYGRRHRLDAAEYLPSRINGWGNIKYRPRR
jgi:hypothetical protein